MVTEVFLFSTGSVSLATKAILLATAVLPCNGGFLSNRDYFLATAVFTPAPEGVSIEIRCSSIATLAAEALRMLKTLL